MANKKLAEEDPGIVEEDGVDSMWVRVRVMKDSNPELFTHLAAVGLRRRSDRLRMLAIAGLANLSLKVSRSLVELANVPSAQKNLDERVMEGMDKSQGGVRRFGAAMRLKAAAGDDFIGEVGGGGDDGEVGSVEKAKAASLRQRAKSAPPRSW